MTRLSTPQFSVIVALSLPGAFMAAVWIGRGLGEMVQVGLVQHQSRSLGLLVVASYAVVVEKLFLSG